MDNKKTVHCKDASYISVRTDFEKEGSSGEWFRE